MFRTTKCSSSGSLYKQLCGILSCIYISSLVAERLCLIFAVLFAVYGRIFIAAVHMSFFCLTSWLQIHKLHNFRLFEETISFRWYKYINIFDVHESVHRDIIVKVTNKIQLYRLIYYSKSALHVSGDVFAHHQEHLTVFTVSGSVHPSCCWLVSWMSWNADLLLLFLCVNLDKFLLELRLFITELWLAR
jgi:hypothetical protein